MGTASLCFGSDRVTRQPPAPTPAGATPPPGAHEFRPCGPRREADAPALQALEHALAVDESAVLVHRVPPQRPAELLAGELAGTDRRSRLSDTARTSRRSAGRASCVEADPRGVRHGEEFIPLRGGAALGAESGHEAQRRRGLGKVRCASCPDRGRSLSRCGRLSPRRVRTFAYAPNRPPRPRQPTRVRPR